MKKIICLVVSAVLMMQALMFNVAAVEEPPIMHAERNSVVDKLVTLGVLDESRIHPLDKKITRGEFFEMVVDVFELREFLKTPECTYFYDVPITHPAIKEINCLHEFGYINGDTEGNVHPEAEITLTDALVIVLRAMGYGYVAERSGGYPTGYHMVANKYDALKDVDIDSEKGFVAEDVYQLFENCCDMLVCSTFPATSNSVQYVLEEGNTLLWVLKRIRVDEGIVTSNRFTGLVESRRRETDAIEIDGEEYAVAYTDCYDMLGMSVRYYTKEINDEETVLYAESLQNEVTRVYGDKFISISGLTATYYVDDNKKEKLAIDKKHDVIYNGIALSRYGTLAELIPANGYIDFLDNDKDGAAEVIFVQNAKNIVIKDIDSDAGIVYDRLTGAKINLQESNITTDMRLADGTAIGFGQLELGDVVSIFESKNTTGHKLMTLLVSRGNLISGKISEFNIEENRYIINGTTYRKSVDCIDELFVGQSGTYYLNYLGEIVLYEATDSNMRVGIVRGTMFASPWDRLLVRIFTSDGVFEDYECNESICVDGTRSSYEELTDKQALANRLQAGIMVRYRLNADGKIIELCFPGATGSNSEEFKLMFEGGAFRYNSSIIDGLFLIDGSTHIFSVPIDKTADDEYRILPQGNILRGVNLNFAYKAYFLGDNKLKPAYAMQISGMSAGQIREDAMLITVSEVTNGIYNDEPVQVIYAIESDYKVKLYLTDDKKQEIEDRYGISLNLRPGVVFKYTANSAGEIENFKLVYDGTRQGEVTPDIGAESIPENTQQFDYAGRIIYGTVNEVDGNVMSYTIPIVGREEVRMTSSAKVIKVDSSRNLVSNGTWSDIHKDDVIVVRSQGGTPREIIIFR